MSDDNTVRLSFFRRWLTEHTRSSYFLEDFVQSGISMDTFLFNSISTFVVI